MRFCTVTLGCKVNQYETQALEGILASRGHESVSPGGGCDVCIINTCAVTSESARKSRQAVRSIKKTEPSALIAVCGCLSQIEPETPAILGADITGGSGDRLAFALEIERVYNRIKASHEEGPADCYSYHAEEDAEAPATKGCPEETVKTPQNRPAYEELPPGNTAGRTRALLKIQDGCDNYCAYCVIPYARGRARSLPAQRAAEYARRLGGRGYREIVVTGIEISSYGKDFPEDAAASLTDVVRMIGEAAQDARIRLGSLDPGAITGDFVAGMAALGNLCGHFHLSLQSGCDETLRRMGRKYDTGAVRRALSLLRKEFPGCGVTADLITGFPGETDEEFRQTMEFITESGFSRMHVFPFSARPGTRAADMRFQVEKSVRRERARIASEAAESMSNAFKQDQMGRILRVLFERETGGAAIGYSDNYVEVAVKSGAAGNSVHNVQIYAVENGFVWAEIV